jgi:hypothetical protein
MEEGPTRIGNGGQMRWVGEEGLIRAAAAGLGEAGGQGRWRQEGGLREEEREG